MSIPIYSYQHGRESINKHCWVIQNISWINVWRIIQRLKFLWMIMAWFWLGTHSLGVWHGTRIYQGLIWLIISLLLVLIIVISISKYYYYWFDSMFHSQALRLYCLCCETARYVWLERLEDDNKTTMCRCLMLPLSDHTSCHRTDREPVPVTVLSSRWPAAISST